MHFLLLHGSVLGPWCWTGVVERLAALGHYSTCPDLPFDVATAAFAEHLAAIDGALEGGTPDVVVAHSASGLLAPALPYASTTPTVYLAAFLADEHRSVGAQWDDEPDMFSSEWTEWGAAPPWEDADRAHLLLLHDCAPAVAARVLERLRPDQSRLAQQRAPASAALPAAVVVPTLDRTITPAWMRRAARERLGVEPYEIDAGHLPQISHPVAAADIILQAACSAGQR